MSSNRLAALLARLSCPSPSQATRATIAAFFFLILFALYYAQNPSALHDPSWEDKEQTGVLSKLLQQAELPGNKTVIFTSVNAAWAAPGSLLEVFLESFKLLNRTQQDLLKHLIVLTFDQQAHDRCMQVHLLCYQVRTDGVDFTAAKAYMSHDYVKMMWRRIEFLNIVLRMGYSFIFSDADIIWLRNPFPHLLLDKDFQISCDRYNGNTSSLDNAPNGGFTFAHSNQRTINFYKFWYDSRLTYPAKHDQDVFIEIRHHETMRKIGVKVGILDTKFFVSFCSHWTYDINISSTIHANCCNGLQNKIRNLKTLLVNWNEFTSNKTKEVKVWKGPDRCTFDPI